MGTGVAAESADSIQAIEQGLIEGEGNQHLVLSALVRHKSFIHRRPGLVKKM